MEKNGIHIIDLNKTEAKLEEAAGALKQIAKSGRKILFVATKKQAKDIVAEKVKAINMPYVTERWPGGMLTNFPTIRKAVKKMSSIDRMESDGTFTNLSKREKLQIGRQRAKLEKMLGSISDLTRLPAAMFIVDITKEYIAVREARRLNIPVFAMVDTNSNPRDIDFAIPANDDASKSISLILDYVCEAITDGLNERKMEKEKEASSAKEKKEKQVTEEGEKKAEGKSPARTPKPRRSAAKVEKPAADTQKAEAKEAVKQEEKPEAAEKAAPKEEKPAAEPKAEEKSEEKAADKN
jgi:small subunit ribosomal protein S2